jgi:hypothetical protein
MPIPRFPQLYDYTMSRGPAWVSRIHNFVTGLIRYER